MKPRPDSLLLRVLCLRTHQTVFNKENSYHCERNLLLIGIFFIKHFVYEILSPECASTKLGVTVNHVLVSLASPCCDLALHLGVLSNI